MMNYLLYTKSTNLTFYLSFIVQKQHPTELIGALPFHYVYL